MNWLTDLSLRAKITVSFMLIVLGGASISTLGGSLIVSLTVIPVAASFLLRRSAHGDPWLPRQLERGYRPLLWISKTRNEVVAL